MLTFKKLRSANLTRNYRYHPDGVNHWSLSDWGVAMAGEAGEACDAIKKLNRDRDGVPGNHKTRDDLLIDLGKEIADTIIYLDLLAARAGLDLEEVVIQKFNEVSDRVGFPDRLDDT